MAGDTGKRKTFSSSRGKTFGGVQAAFADIWWAWGTTKFMPGASIPRNMTIIREGEELVIIHPVLLPDAMQKEVEELGEIKHIVRLGDFHGMDDALYVERYADRVGARGRDGARGGQGRPGAEGGRRAAAEGRHADRFLRERRARDGAPPVPPRRHHLHLRQRRRTTDARHRARASSAD